jgi:2-methylcitrate dehydratase PrpD
MLAIIDATRGEPRIAIATGPSPYQNGFHWTGTFGTFNAAGACGRQLGLDVEQMRCAFGLAATQAAGLKASFGTMGKHLNAANAGVSGLLAAELAARGFTAPVDAIEPRHGFEWTQSATFDPAARPR